MNDKRKRSFEDDVRRATGIKAPELHTLLKIGEGLHPDLASRLRGSDVADDVDALLMLTRLTFEQQRKLVVALDKGLLPKLAVALMVSGELPRMLDE